MSARAVAAALSILVLLTGCLDRSGASQDAGVEDDAQGGPQAATASQGDGTGGRSATDAPVDGGETDGPGSGGEPQDVMDRFESAVLGKLAGLS